ncbi:MULTISPECIES: exonuclease subunit SbcD [unclassified Thermosynechococcus]|uniref:exonuclease subunit SbcD n=1 Tax=unclassified Thermosynechococcus TaxID=2622553 RepID=UPI00197F4749|nr:MULTISPECIES: exonuclease subunit SbcD [unclassified Thermosynechococcus]QSF48116.1 exonuclease subunit SbcD [Thermosynechococcus sp. TA-1]
MKILHVSDIHLGSGLSHGHINPATGLNTRLEDFIAALATCIDRALSEPVDLVLFGGDAFPDATPPPLVHEAFASQFRRLADARIPTVLLVGNHDQHAQGQGGASLSLYRTLGVPGFIVGDRLATHRIETRRGSVQVITLPWLTRSTLLTRPETSGLSLAEVHQLLLERLRLALEGEIRQLDPALPTVLLAHAMVDTAQYGSERYLSAGKGFTIPLSFLARPCFDYVALGHVHRHQVLCHDPPVVYPGSIERVDFGEEGEEKGYVLVNLAKGKTEFQFCPLPTRPFRTIRVDLTELELDPQAALLGAIASGEISGAVVRVMYQLRPDQIPLINLHELQKALESAHSVSLLPQLVNSQPIARLPEVALEQCLDPSHALQLYLDHHPDLEPLHQDLLAALQTLNGHSEEESQDTPEMPRSPEGRAARTPEPVIQQLKLLS